VVVSYGFWEVHRGRAYLKTADERIRNVVLEEMASLVVYARPAPHVLVVVLRFALVEDCCSDGPHDDAEDEEANSEDGIVCGDFLGSIVTSLEVCNHDNHRHEERDTGDGQDQDLWPNLGVFGPCWEVVSWCESLGGVEDGEGGCNHGQDDQTAGEVDASEEDLGYPYSYFDFLWLVSSPSG
jgi:hypothetical protein